MERSSGSQSLSSNSENSKERMKNHRHNKNKYKPQKYRQKPTEATQSASTQPARKTRQKALGCNWDRYEQEEVDDSNVLTNSTNFQLYAEAPITLGSHFQFKSDKSSDYSLEFESLISNPDTEKLFKFNLDLLDKSISSIPFSRRCDITETRFTENQKRIMAATAQDNLKLYKKSFADKFNEAKLMTSRELMRLGISKSQEESYADALDGMMEEIDKQLDLDDSSNIVLDSSNAADMKGVASDTEDDDEWLENFLAS